MRAPWWVAVAAVVASSVGGGCGLGTEAPPRPPAPGVPGGPELSEIDRSSGFPEGGGGGAYPAVEPALAEASLQIAPEDLATLDAAPYADAMVPARFTLGGRTAPALVRYRGSSSRTHPQKSFKISLADGAALDGRDRFALLAEWVDAGKLTERFAVDLFRALGLPVPRGRYVRLDLNGVPNGVYLDKERVVGEFLRDHELERDASVYHCGSRDCELKFAPPGPYQHGFEKTRNEQLPDDDLDELLRIVNRTDDAHLVRLLAERMDLDAYLGTLAVDALVSNNLLEDSGAYLIHELARDRWTWVPWDLNNMLPVRHRDTTEADPPRGVTRDPRVFTVYDPWVDRIYRARALENASQRPTWSVLATRLWDVPETRERIVSWLEAALAGPFSEESASAHVAQLWGAAGEAILADPYVVPDLAATSPAYLERFVRERRAFLLGSLAALRAHGGGPLVVNEIAFAGGGGPGYVELFNRGDAPIDLGGLCITDDLRTPDRHALPAGLIVPAHGHQVLVADGSLEPGHLPFQPSAAGGEIGVFRSGTVHDPLDVVYFGPHGAGRAYGRSPDGAERFTEADPTPGLPAAPAP
jgi:spore coat protein H